MGSEEVVFIHGDLDLWILEARSLPNMDLMAERMRKCFTILGTCRSHIQHTKNHKMITSDPYVSVCLAGATIARTRVILNSEDPKWEEHFNVPVAHPVTKIEFQVKDNDLLGAELIGVVSIPVSSIIEGKKINGWFSIAGARRSSVGTYPELKLSIQFKHFESNPLYSNGVGTFPNFSGVPNAYFPVRKDGNVTLYQDAHVPDGALPKIVLDDGKIFEQNKCWEDICHAILEAHHLIYIVGWSIFHPVKLVREPTKPLPKGGELSLGELLKYKSEEGVRVLVLIWDDRTSYDKLLIKTTGFMKTHDEEARKFFKHSSIHCVLAPRYPSNKLSFFKKHVVGTLFSHHQKCVLVDSQASGNNRKITAFLGGLDLCDGRYDTPEHRICTDLDTVFANDFHNPIFPTRNKGPRQAWHDLHCKIEGPAAYDVLTNFEQRWQKATKLRDFRLKKVRRRFNDDVLIKLDRISWIVTPQASVGDDHNVRVSYDQDPENWHVQVFRSIDSGSVKGFPKDVQEAESRSLVCEKNLTIDKSIHTAYVKAIRSAQHFIYIENQYFFGSSYNWPSYKNAGADNLVPMEMALKIASKIRANERFSVYIVIPMFPDGLPNSVSVQEMLYWQGQTIAMMYGVVASALTEVGLSDSYHPQDYLNFYCLGKRETNKETAVPDQPADHTHSNMVQKYHRFMIYVHAKGMIVDDEFVMIGSANINERSLCGSRDTEIAMGAYQPIYSWSGQNKHPHGQVFGYRMSLWAEHLGVLEDSFNEPETLTCVRRVNQLAQHNWETYVSEETNEMKGHLMRYPVHVRRDGKIEPLSGFENFPDVGGKILGAHGNLPDVLTT